MIREEVSLSQSRGEERSQKRLKLEAHGCKPLQKSHKRIVSEVSRRRREVSGSISRARRLVVTVLFLLSEEEASKHHSLFSMKFNPFKIETKISELPVLNYGVAAFPRVFPPHLNPSPASLSLLQRALYFPNISGTCLLDRKTIHTADMLPGKVSIISLLSSKISEEHTKSFYEPTLEAFGGNKDFQLLQVSMFSVQGEQVGGSKRRGGVTLFETRSLDS